MSEHDYAVILAGGKGERFWPLSTAARPKQLLSLVGDKSLLLQAVERLAGLIPLERVFIITSKDLAGPSREAVPALPADHVIGEPVGRDTAAAVALAAALVGARDPQGAFCILTADHIIGDLDVFQMTLKEGLALAAHEDVLITVGIQPAKPSTGYGYIEAGEPLPKEGGVTFRRAVRFIEKPDRGTAEQYLADGNFYWNSGMFLWSVRSVTEGLRKHHPRLAKMIARLQPLVNAPDFDAAFREEYLDLEKISIDYALMEKADNIVMAEGLFSWDDVGSWTALENHFPRDEQGNLVLGETATLDATGNIVISRERLTAVVGVSDVVVVQADGVTLVCARDRVQDVKKIVAQLREAGGHEKVL